MNKNFDFKDNLVLKTSNYYAKSIYVTQLFDNYFDQAIIGYEDAGQPTGSVICWLGKKEMPPAKVTI